MTETERLEKLEGRIERAARYCQQMDERLSGIEAQVDRIEEIVSALRVAGAAMTLGYASLPDSAR